jgi:hypothetical protein
MGVGVAIRWHTLTLLFFPWTRLVAFRHTFVTGIDRDATATTREVDALDTGGPGCNPATQASTRERARNNERYIHRPQRATTVKRVTRRLPDVPGVMLPMKA